MKNKNIKEAYDKILPTKSEKEKMLAHIVSAKEKRGFPNKKWVQNTLLFTTACVMLLLVFYPELEGQPKLEENTPSITRMMVSDKIEYKGECYEYVGIHSGEMLVHTKEKFMGGSVYQIRNQKDSIVVQLEGVYKHYQKCRGE